MNAAPLRLGAFGVGRMGQVHLENLIALHQAGEIELVAIGDRHGPMLSSAFRQLTELGGPDMARWRASTTRTAWRLLRDWMGDRRVTHRGPRARQSGFHRSRHARVRREAVRQLDCRGRRLLPKLARIDWCRWRFSGTSTRRPGPPSPASPRPHRSAPAVASRPAGQNPTRRLQSCGITGQHGDSSRVEARSVHRFELPARSRRWLAAQHYDDRAGEGATSSTRSARGPMARSPISGARGSTARIP